jgi:epoxyqueuosine reductase QueG
MEERCGTCTQCTDACPAQAISGREFHEEEPREARFDAAACDRYFREMEKSKGIPVCGMCLYICPYGRKARVPDEAGHKGSAKKERGSGKRS